MDFLKKISPFIILLCSLVFPKHLYAIEILDRIVAVVNNHVITQQQLSEQIEMTRQQWQAENKLIPDAATLRKQVLNQMIDNELQLQLAASSGLKIDNAALDKAIMSIAQHNGFTLEELREKLQQENIAYAKYRQQIRQQLIINRLQQDEVAAKITVTDQETKDMLAHMPKSLQKIAYHVENLLIPFPNEPSAADISRVKKTALSLLQQAKNGISFQQLISQASQPNSLIGGDLGWRPLNDLPDIFEEPLLMLKPGEIAGPIQADNGFHLIRLLEIRGDDSTEPAHYVTSTHTRHILIKTSPLLNSTQAEKRLKEIRADILRGGNFATLAKKYSQDPGSAYRGGDLGWTFPGFFDPAFETQIKKLSIHQISLPFQTQFGWHIVQVLGRSQKLQPGGNISRKQAAQLVYQRKFQQALKNWLHQIRNQSYVKIM